MRKHWWLIAVGYITLILFGTLVVRGRSALEWVYLLIPPGTLQEKLIYVLQNHHPLTFSKLLTLVDSLVNIGLFLPLGLALALVLQSRVSWDIRGLLVCALGVGFVLSVGIELLQAYVPHRVPSSADVVMNTGGMVFGCYLPYFRKAYAQHNTSENTGQRRQKP